MTCDVTEPPVSNLEQYISTVGSVAKEYDMSKLGHLGMLSPFWLLIGYLYRPFVLELN